VKAITIHQPWAAMIAAGWKTIETRTHDRFIGLEGQTIAIHASARVPSDDQYIFAMRYREGARGQYVDGLQIARGCVVAVAHVVDARWLFGCFCREAMCEAYGKFGLFLADVVRLKDPIKARGRQGIWTLPPEVEAQVRRQVG